jgi:hypothetical protein
LDAVSYEMGENTLLCSESLFIYKYLRRALPIEVLVFGMPVQSNKEKNIGSIGL